MKIVARCPRCGVRIPRYFVLASGPLVDVTCPACGRRLRVEPRVDRLTGLAFGLPVGVLIALGAIGYLAWIFVIIDIAILGAIGWIAFPYLTTFVAAPDEDEDQTGAR